MDQRGIGNGGRAGVGMGKRKCCELWVRVGEVDFSLEPRRGSIDLVPPALGSSNPGRG